MTEHQTLIYNFLKYHHLEEPDFCPIGMDRLENDIFPHYNCKQIELFGNIHTTKKEMSKMEKLGLVKHYWFKDHGNCYYAI